MLGAEYEPKYFYWDAFILLRRFAALGAMLIAPSASRALQLSILLALGLVSLFIHMMHGPFDNRSGTLLDVMEAQALKIFCATCATMLLGFSEVAHFSICFGLVFIVILMHVIFILRLIVHLTLQVQRSVAEGLIDDVMLRVDDSGLQDRGWGVSASIGSMSSWITSFPKERIFLREVQSQRKRGHVHFRPVQGELELAPGPEQGTDVTDYERIFVAQGLADVVKAAVMEHKVERLSVRFMEFVSRVAFATKWDRLQTTEEQIAVLSLKHHKIQVESNQGTGFRRHGSRGMFHPDAFRLGMSASDFQLELINICICSRESLDSCFQEFMQNKGLIEHPVTRHDILLGAVANMRRSSKEQRRSIHAKMGAKSLSTTGLESASLESKLASLEDSQICAAEDTDQDTDHIAVPVTEFESPVFAMTSDEDTGIEQDFATAGTEDSTAVGLGIVRRGSGLSVQKEQEQVPVQEEQEQVLETSLPGTVAQTIMIRTPSAGRDPSMQQVDAFPSLQDVEDDIINFVRKGIQGVSCLYFKERSRERLPAVYRFSEGAETLAIFVGDDYSRLEVVCPIGSVTGVTRLDRDAADLMMALHNFPGPVLDMLRMEEADRLVMVTFKRAFEVARFCFLEESSEAADKFLQSMQALILHIETVGDSTVGSNVGGQSVGREYRVRPGTAETNGEKDEVGEGAGEALDDPFMRQVSAIKEEDELSDFST
jgi:hypothetical protein